MINLCCGFFSVNVLSLFQLCANSEPTQPVCVTVCNFIINVLDSPFASSSKHISINMCMDQC